MAVGRGLPESACEVECAVTQVGLECGRESGTNIALQCLIVHGGVIEQIRVVLI